MCECLCAFGPAPKVLLCSPVSVSIHSPFPAFLCPGSIIISCPSAQVISIRSAGAELDLTLARPSGASPPVFVCGYMFRVLTNFSDCFTNPLSIGELIPFLSLSY